MSISPLQCAVCSRPTNGYNYGILTCNACKMFFRRIVVRNDVTNCRFRAGNCTSYCSFCRFSKCVHAGMMMDPVTSTHDFKNNEVILSVVIQNLIYLDNHRLDIFKKSYCNGDPSFENVSNSRNFMQKPVGYKMSISEWGMINTISGFDFLKKIHFMKDLNADDQSIILRNFLIQFGVFSIAQFSQESNLTYLSFPDGTKIPEDNIKGVSETLKNRVQFKLIARLIDLDLTREEFLLLTVIFLCNPAVPELSDHGKCIIISQQKYYTAALHQYCLLTHQKSGPTRFTDLLFLYQVILKTYEDCAALHRLQKMLKLQRNTKKIFMMDD